MIDTITGGSRSRKEWAERAAYFAHHQLMPRRKKLSVRVSIVNELQTNYGLFGDCLEVDHGEGFYMIRVSSGLDPEQFTRTMLHEMVHVKQFARRELKFNARLDVEKGSFMHRWKMDLFSEDTSYWKCPWEKEAHHFEDTMFRSFTNHFSSHRFVKSMSL
jgi:hypothetical protein